MLFFFARDLPLLKFENISFSYRPDSDVVRPVFSGFNMHIGQGEYLVIAGANGSGKSTLAALIKGLISSQEGKISYFGRDVTGLGVNHRIGYLFSNPENQIVSPVVEDDVAFGPENYGGTDEEIGAKVKQSLLLTKCSHLKKELTHLLSGGQQQRVNMAGVFALYLDCIILDEAASMLDPVSQNELLALVRDMHIEKGLSLIQLTHNINEILSADRVIVLREGTIAFDGAPSELMENDRALDLLGASTDAAANLLRRLLHEDIIKSEDVNSPDRIAGAINGFAQSRVD